MGKFSPTRAFLWACSADAKPFSFSAATTFGFEMEQISTLLSLLPAARGSNDVSGSARYLEPNDEQPDELPLRAAPQLPERDMR